MGLFDFFGKRKKEEQEAAELLNAIIQYQVESRKDGVDTDEIPKDSLNNPSFQHGPS
jgi:hypothetical protein